MTTEHSHSHSHSRARNGNPSFRTRAIATRVRELRTQRKMSGQKLSDLMALNGITFSRSTVANLENDRRDVITVDELFALAASLNTTIDYLAGGIGHECSNCNDEPPFGFACVVCKRER